MVLPGLYNDVKHVPTEPTTVPTVVITHVLHLLTYLLLHLRTCCTYYCTYFTRTYYTYCCAASTTYCYQHTRYIRTALLMYESMHIY